MSSGPALGPRGDRLVVATRLPVVPRRRVGRRDPPPGRPAARGGPLPLTPPAMEAGDPRQARGRGAELNDGLAGVRDSFKARLFGDPGTLVPAARKVAPGSTPRSRTWTA